MGVRGNCLEKMVLATDSGEKLNMYLSSPTSINPALLKPFKDLFKVDIADETTCLWHSSICVTDRPCALEDPAMQALQERAHKIAEDKKAQQAEEQAEDDDIVGRLVSATMSSAFRTATGAPPQQYAIRQQQKSCD